jgi:hypothetical protein
MTKRRLARKNEASTPRLEACSFYARTSPTPAWGKSHSGATAPDLAPQLLEPKAKRERERERCISKLLRHLARAHCGRAPIIGAYVPLELTLKHSLLDPLTRSLSKKANPPVLKKVDHGRPYPKPDPMFTTGDPDGPPG